MTSYKQRSLLLSSILVFFSHNSINAFWSSMESSNFNGKKAFYNYYADKDIINKKDTEKWAEIQKSTSEALKKLEPVSKNLKELHQESTIDPTKRQPLSKITKMLENTVNSVNKALDILSEVKSSLNVDVHFYIKETNTKNDYTVLFNIPGFISKDMKILINEKEAAITLEGTRETGSSFNSFSYTSSKSNSTGVIETISYKDGKLNMAVVIPSDVDFKSAKIERLDEKISATFLIKPE